MDWQRNFVFDCLAGRAGLETAVSTADSETELVPAMTTYLLPFPTGAFRATLTSTLRQLPIPVGLSSEVVRSFTPTSLFHRGVGSEDRGVGSEDNAAEANAITSDFANPDDIVIRPTARLSQRMGSNGLVACPDPAVRNILPGAARLARPINREHSDEGHCLGATLISYATASHHWRSRPAASSS